MAPPRERRTVAAAAQPGRGGGSRRNRIGSLCPWATAFANDRPAPPIACRPMPRFATSGRGTEFPWPACGESRSRASARPAEGDRGVWTLSHSGTPRTPPAPIRTPAGRSAGPFPCLGDDSGTTPSSRPNLSSCSEREPPVHAPQLGAQGRNFAQPHFLVRQQRLDLRRAQRCGDFLQTPHRAQPIPGFDPPASLFQGRLDIRRRPFLVAEIRPTSSAARCTNSSNRGCSSFAIGARTFSAS